MIVFFNKCFVISMVLGMNDFPNCPKVVYMWQGWIYEERVEVCIIIIIYNVRQSDVNLSLGPTMLKDPFGARWGLLPALRWVDFWFFLQVKRIFHSWELNHQPLHSDLGTSSLASGSLGPGEVTPLSS